MTDGNSIHSLSKDLIVGSLLLFLVKIVQLWANFLLSQWFVKNVYVKATVWFNQHPVHHAFFLHYHHKYVTKKGHTAKNPRLCEDETCKIVPI